jgi:hypothetical protein
MSTVTFDGQAHILRVRDRHGRVVGTGPANNRTDSHANLQFVPNGIYTVQDPVFPHRHGGAEDTVNGMYGTFGIVRFVVDGYVGVGIHAGRQSQPDSTPQRAIGPDHVTKGCIRTNEETMRCLTELMRNDPLLRVIVRNNRRQR